MTPRFHGMWLAAFCVVVALTPCHAKGRRPDDEEDDKFPDYNRMEMHPKRKTEPAPPVESERPVPPPPRPSLNTPANLPPSEEDDSVPKPPPAAVPLPSGASEPPLPDDMMGTLVPTATVQTSTSTAP